jgi:hypothetical protein
LGCTKPDTAGKLFLIESFKQNFMVYDGGYWVLYIQEVEANGEDDLGRPWGVLLLVGVYTNLRQGLKQNYKASDKGDAAPWHIL